MFTYISNMKCVNYLLTNLDSNLYIKPYTIYMLVHAFMLHVLVYRIVKTLVSFINYE